MKEKYFCILAYISLKLITTGLSHRQKDMAINGDIYKKQINLVEQRGLGYKLAKLYREFLEQLPTTFVKWLSAGLYRQEDRPPFLPSSALNIKD